MPPRASTSSASAPGKRRRISEKQPEFGAPSDADLPSARAPSTSSSVYSTRTLPSDRILPLTTMCARIFGNNMLKLSVNEESWATTREWLNLLPDTMIPKILAILSATCPTRLSHGLLIAHFLRGPTITLTDELTGVEKFTIIAIGKAGTDLLELELSGFEKFPDSLFASILPKLPSLRKLVLRGCSKVGPQTVEAAAKSCPHLTTVNFNSTSVTPLSLLPLLVACHSLESLKLAGISNWTDATFAKLSSGLDAHENFRLEKLHTLKLRQTMLTDMSLNYLLGLCPNLRRLDLSFTPVRRPRHRMADTIPPLEKLSLTSTRVSGADLLTIVAHLPQLKTLAIGALGGGQGSTATISNSSAMTMTDDILIALTDILVKYESLENINLVGNSKLGVSGRKTALIEFVRRVGRRCKRLNLANIPSLSSWALEGLVADSAEDPQSNLEVLVLNNTRVDDEAAPFISSCPSLRTLELEGTKFTNVGLYPIIDACAKLEQLNLTSCRGVRVGDRRRFFEVWESDWKEE